jgi:succinylarginine dihydrolase
LNNVLEVEEEILKNSASNSQKSKKIEISNKTLEITINDMINKYYEKHILEKALSKLSVLDKSFYEFNNLKKYLKIESLKEKNKILIFKIKDLS